MSLKSDGNPPAEMDHPSVLDSMLEEARAYSTKQGLAITPEMRASQETESTLRRDNRNGHGHMPLIP